MKPARSVDAAESHPSRPAEAAEQSEPHIYPVESATLESRYYNPTDFRTIMTNLQTRQDPSMKAENWGAQHKRKDRRAGDCAPARRRAAAPAGRLGKKRGPCKSEAAQFRRLPLVFSHYSRMLSNCVSRKRIEKGSTLDFRASRYVFLWLKLPSFGDI